MVQAYLAGQPATQLARPMLDWATSALAGERSSDFPPASDERQWVLALVHRATLEGDSTEVRRLLHKISTADTQSETADPMPAALQASLQARLALLARDTTRAIGMLERAISRSAGPYTIFFPLSAMAPQRLLLAELLAARGERRRSERLLDSFSHSWSLGDVLYATRVKQIRSQLGR